MTLHLWMWAGGGGQAQRACRSAPEWDYSKTREKLGGVGLWQGAGRKCRHCLNRIEKFLAAFGNQEADR